MNMDGRRQDESIANLSRRYALQYGGTAAVALLGSTLGNGLALAVPNRQSEISRKEKIMPAIILEMAPLTIDQKRSLVTEITESAARITGLPKEGFYVFIKENGPENVGVGGQLIADRKRSQ
jgi:4-oxalocrotonate tautomerase